MTQAATKSQAPLFDYQRWDPALPELGKKYRSSQPFPHLHLANLLDPGVARELMEEFPEPDSHAWIQYKHQNENKMGLPKREMFPPRIGQVVDELNSPEFLAWLSELTGIEGLVSDDTLEGGGLHQSSRGGFLNVHADFTMHHHHKNWRRRINLILYLNEGWQPEWGGAIELWDRKMSRCEARVLPLLNHALIFNTDEHSFHGFPDRLACPEGVSRKSLALYYYTPEVNVKAAGKSTNYRARPSDGPLQAALIWADKQAVNLYSRVKETFGLSDDFASRVLGFLSRKK
ncbi:MAG TPA: 2OG-Fe(II) oxygenase [Candidatus Solibacter sp.]|nr:2OG-Fe(II) oxygenase [Candidatus Solibacter sp.]